MKVVDNKRSIFGASCALEGDRANLVAVADFDKKVKLIDFHNKKLMSTIEGHLGSVNCLRSVDFNSDLLVSGARRDGLLYLWVSLVD